jgi:iron complex outermembrane receptor protein
MGFRGAVGRLRRVAITLSALPIAAAAMPAIAQDSIPSPDATPREEIVVTADVQAKVVAVGSLGTLDILKTPYSVNSVTADTIELRQTRTLIELQKTDPSAQFVFNGFGAPLIAIRGFNADVRLDGVRTQVSAQFPLEFVDRIDIIKGASSFLYGFAAPGGVVDYALKRPGPEAFGSAALSYRSDTDFLGRVDFNQPITDTFAVRVNALYELGDTYLQDDRQDRVAGSIAADWRPTDTLTVSGDYTYQRNAPDSGGATTVLFLPGVALPPSIDPTVRYLQKWERFRIVTQAWGLRGDWEFAPDWTLTLRGRGYVQPRSYYSSGGTVALGGGLYSNTLYAFNDGQDSFAQQARIAGKLMTGELVHNLTFGYDRQDDPTYAANNTQIVTPTPFTLDHPIDDPRPANFSLPDGPLTKSGETIQNSGVLADRIEYGPWTALLALRYIDLTQTNYDPAGAITRNYVAAKATPTIGLLREVGPASVYVSYAQGLEQGGQAPISASNANVNLPPIESSQVEIGVKAKLFDGVTASAALFHVERGYEYLDIANKRYVGDGSQVNQGIEGTLSGTIAPGWNIIAGATYLDAKIENAGATGINGSIPVGVARFQATLFVEHEIADGLFANVGLFHSSGREIDLPNDRKIDGYTTADLGLRYAGNLQNHPVSINANIENITDEHYYGGVYYGFVSLGTPRQFKLTLTTGF